MRKIVVEVICLVLFMYWFYEGVYKMAHWYQFAAYITHAPFLKAFAWILPYGLPIAEVVLAILCIRPKFSKAALCGTIGMLMVYVFWVLSIKLFSDRIFGPFQALCSMSTWTQKTLIAMGVSWLAFSAILLSGIRISKGDTLKSLRNTPVDAS